MDWAFLLQLFNSTFALAIGTEIFISARPLEKQVLEKRKVFIFWLAPNLILAFLSFISGIKQTSTFKWVTTGSYVAQTLVASLLALYALIAFVVFIMTRLVGRLSVSAGFSGGERTLFVVFGMGTFLVIFLILYTSEWHDIFADKAIYFKATLVVITYGLACWFDIKRRRKGLGVEEFLLQFLNASIESAILMPFVAVVFATVFLFISSISSALRVSTEWLNIPIYWGVLYGPWAMVYILVKRRCLLLERNQPTLSNISELPG
mmetsp:Transcript_22169/g.31039  ORF Transcript_22169/g.31039 Transcript_22169/m.31039 type:complete len:263 (+) Transcript_22169:64-852(+)